MANPPHHRALDFLADIDAVREYPGPEACPVALRPAGVFAGAGLYIAYAEKKWRRGRDSLSKAYLS